MNFSELKLFGGSKIDLIRQDRYVLKIITSRFQGFYFSTHLHIQIRSTVSNNTGKGGVEWDHLGTQVSSSTRHLSKKFPITVKVGEPGVRSPFFYSKLNFSRIMCATDMVSTCNGRLGCQVQICYFVLSLSLFCSRGTDCQIHLVNL